MDFNKEVFKEKFKNRLDEKYALDVKDATPQEHQWRKRLSGL